MTERLPLMYQPRWIQWTVFTVLAAAVATALGVIRHESAVYWWTVAAMAPFLGVCFLVVCAQARDRTEAAIGPHSPRVLARVSRAIRKGRLPADPTLIPMVQRVLPLRRAELRRTGRATVWLLVGASLVTIGGLLAGRPSTLVLAAAYFALVGWQLLLTRRLRARLDRVERALTTTVSD